VLGYDADGALDQVFGEGLGVEHYEALGPIERLADAGRFAEVELPYALDGADELF
jgi:hypothetical protein